MHAAMLGDLHHLKCFTTCFTFVSLAVLDQGNNLVLSQILHFCHAKHCCELEEGTVGSTVVSTICIAPVQMACW